MTAGPAGIRGTRRTADRKRTFAALALAVAVLGAFVVAPLSAVAKQPSAALSGPVSGTTDGGGTFAGTVAGTRFAKKDGTLAAVGTLTDPSTGSGSVSKRVTLPVTTQAGSCRVLDLTRGPLDLDLHGLGVHLDAVDPNLTARPGAGTLLGNLLCAVANLLNGGVGLGGALNQIVLLLNRILGALSAPHDRSPTESAAGAWLSATPLWRDWRSRGGGAGGGR